MLSHVIATRHVCQRRLCVAGSRGVENPARRVGVGQGRGNVAHAPRTAEIEAIEMHQLRITSVL